METLIRPKQKKKIFSSTEAQQHFGRLLDTARREPITIQKNYRDIAVLLSIEDYGDLVEKREDAYWGREAQKAAKNGFLSKRASEKYLKLVLHA